MKYSVDIMEPPEPGTGVFIEVDGRPLALFHVAGNLFAIDDECPHAGWKLSEGELSGSIVTCLLHGAQFDVRNGKWVGGIACSDVQCYPVKEEEGGFFIELD